VNKTKAMFILSSIT